MNNCNGCPHYRQCMEEEVVKTKTIKIKALGNRDNRYMTIRRSKQ